MPKPTITLHQALEDVEVRFLYNLPESELCKIDRLFFQIEQAWWFYTDFHADVNPHLPQYKRLSHFAKQIFAHCPLLGAFKEQYGELFADYSAYKSLIPSYGTIMLSPDMKKIVLCQIYGGKSWTFPRGKINENETPLDCANRETYEETGFDPTNYIYKSAAAVSGNKEEDSISWIDGKKLHKLFIATNIPLNTKFLTLTRKEIENVAFHDIDSVTKDGGIKTWGVLPFYSNLKRWIKRQSTGRNQNQNQNSNQIDKTTAGSSNTGKSKKEKKISLEKANRLATAVIATASGGKTKRSNTKDKDKSSSRNGNSIDAFNGDTFEGKVKGWSTKDMFLTNEMLTGKKLDVYDGNVHTFGAYHPRYVDFNAKDASAASASAVSTSMPMHTLPAPHEVVSHLDALRLMSANAAAIPVPPIPESPERKRRKHLITKIEEIQRLLSNFQLFSSSSTSADTDTGTGTGNGGFKVDIQKLRRAIRKTLPLGYPSKSAAAAAATASSSSSSSSSKSKSGRR